MRSYDISRERTGSLAEKIAEASSGDEIIYHTGEFCAGPHKADAMRLSDGGLCILYQRKLEKFRFQYIAKKL